MIDNCAMSATVKRSLGLEPAGKATLPDWI
jgi:hypothetical protein